MKFLNQFSLFFFIDMTMTKDLSAKYQKIKKDYKKQLIKDVKIFLKNKKKKSGNMVVNVTKISQKMKNKSLLSIENNVIKRERTLYCNYKKVF